MKTQPSSATVAAGASSSFTLSFTPASGGSKTATVTIKNNDSDEGTYAFTVTGTSGSPGSLDSNIGTSGIVTTARSQTEYISCLAIQADGKILAGGYASDGSQNDFMLLRYTSAGVLDTTFGTAGVTVLDLQGGVNDPMEGIAIQADGKILAVGSTQTADIDFALVRFTSSGALDTSFGSGGKIILDIKGLSLNDWGKSVTVLSDGGILAAATCGTSTYTNTAVLKFTSSGTLDTSFGSSGIALAQAGFYGDKVASMKVQTDGKIVVAVAATLGSEYDAFGLVRFTTAGALDTTFGTGGSVTTKVGLTTSNDAVNSLAIEADGKILVGGYSNSGSTNDFTVLRFTTAGALDASFASSGILKTVVGMGDSEVKSLAVLPDGSFVAAGYAFDASASQFMIARYTSSGSAYSGFGTTNPVITTISTVWSQAYSLAVQGDGLVVIGGYTDNVVTSADASLARYWP